MLHLKKRDVETYYAVLKEIKLRDLYNLYLIVSSFDVASSHFQIPAAGHPQIALEEEQSFLDSRFFPASHSS